MLIMMIHRVIMERNIDDKECKEPQIDLKKMKRITEIWKMFCLKIYLSGSKRRELLTSFETHLLNS